MSASSVTGSGTSNLPAPDIAASGSCAADTSAGAERPLVVGLGEALIRLTAQQRVLLERATALTVDVGGAELNALVALAQLGCRTRWVSRLPQSPLGRHIAGHARRHGVDLEVGWDNGSRAGLYFVEEGSAPRPTQVLYDRAGSAASRLQPGMFDWPRVLRSAAVLHCSGITCALGPDAEKAVLEAFEVAAGAGVTVSFDVNYRSQLWPPQTAAETLRRVLPFVDVLFASPFDLGLLAGKRADAGLAEEVRQSFGLALVVVRTQRELSPGVIGVNVDAFGSDQRASGSAQATVLDAFGAGDAAVAAFLACWLSKAPLEQAAAEAAKASAYMYTIPGDTWLRPPDGVDADGSRLGRIIR
ncbi:MAG TPA: sugar kinase [Streptosporangiaceae bacterium]|nr:sugar kinase [Streptosporangiaceae bacterium]